MNKKLAVVLSLVFIVVMGLNTFAAQTSYDIVSKMVDRTNTTIDKEVDAADRVADKLYKNYLKDLERWEGNDFMTDKITSAFNIALDSIVASLKSSTDALSESTIAAAALFGIEVECVLEEMEVGPTTVMIDPLRIADD